MVLTNAEIRPRPLCDNPDTPLHEVAINTWMCVERMVTPRQRRWRIADEMAAMHSVDEAINELEHVASRQNVG
jgi:hypothetical protein